MIIKKILATGIILLATNLVSSSVVLAQSTEENITTENSEQLEIIDNNNAVIECVLASEFNAMTEQEQENIELPICEEPEVEVTTEELAAEAEEQNTVVEESISETQCIPAADYDAMTDQERATIEEPLCDEPEPETEENTETLKSE